MPETPNHGYNVPNEGEQDWHEPLNENFEAYDTDIEIRDEAANGGNYEPKQGAKFLATDTGDVYVGDGSSWRPVPNTGTRPELDSVDVEGRGTFGEVTTDNIGAGTLPTDRVPFQAKRDSGSGAAVKATTESGDNTATAIRAEASSSSGNTFGVYSACRSSEGTAVFATNFADSGNTVGVDGRVSSPDGIGVLASNRNGSALEAYGDCKIDGDLDVSGNKNFTQTVDTGEGPREVVYTASESPTPRTEVSGVASLANGRAEVDLPEHFGWVTSDAESLVVETTPYSVDSDGLAVTERSTDRLVFEDLAGEGDYEFSYTARGTREGHEDKPVVRVPAAEGTEVASSTPADD